MSGAVAIIAVLLTVEGGLIVVKGLVHHPFPPLSADLSPDHDRSE